MSVPNPLRSFNWNRLGHTSAGCKTTAKCVRCMKEKHDGECDGPPNCSNCSGPHAASAKDCPAWQMKKEIQRIRVEKLISFQKARELVEGETPAICSQRKRETDLERVMMTRSSASVSMGRWKMRAGRLRQHVVNLPLRAMAEIIQWNIHGIRSNIRNCSCCVSSTSLR